MLTEEQARAKWCPFARTHIGAMHGAGNVAINRSPSPIKEVNCIASACMAWRQAQTSDWQRPDGAMIVGHRDLGGVPGRWLYRGYCGAFGKVEP